MGISQYLVRMHEKLEFIRLNPTEPQIQCSPHLHDVKITPRPGGVSEISRAGRHNSACAHWLVSTDRRIAQLQLFRPRTAVNLSIISLFSLIQSSFFLFASTASHINLRPLHRETLSPRTPIVTSSIHNAPQKGCRLLRRYVSFLATQAHHSP